MKVMRTPEKYFNDLPDFDYEPKYIEIKDGNRGSKDAGGLPEMAAVCQGITGI